MQLDEIIASVNARIEARKGEISETRMMDLGEIAIGVGGGTGAYRTFQEALRSPGLSVIAEVRQASPARSLISDDFPYIDVAYDFEAGEADAISCVTEPHWFCGSNEMFLEVRDEVSVPILRRDFIIDPYQVYESKYLGADAVLLSCALLNDDELMQLLEACEKLHMDALVLARNEEEVARAVASQAAIVGVSNRNLVDFSVDPDRAARLRELVPGDRAFVAVSGIGSVEDAQKARDAGADAILVGEILLRCEDSDERQALLREMAEIK